MQVVRRPVHVSASLVHNKSVFTPNSDAILFTGYGCRSSVSKISTNPAEFEKIPTETTVASDEEYEHVSSITVSPCGTYAAYSTCRYIYVWDMAKNAKITEIHNQKFYGPNLMFLSQEPILVANQKTFVTFYDALTGKELHNIQFSNAYIIAISHDNTKIATYCNEEKSICIWDMYSNQKRYIPFRDEMFNFTFSPDDRTLYAWDGYHKLYTLDMCTGKIVCQSEICSSKANFLPNGSLLLFQSTSGSPIIYKTSTMTPNIHQPEIPEDMEYICGGTFSENGRHLLLEGDTRIELYDLFSSKLDFVFLYEMLSPFLSVPDIADLFPM